MSKIKFLDFSVQGTGKDPDTERLVTEGIRTVADRGKLATCFRDKGGIFWNAGMYGDGFLGFGAGENDENPVAFRVFRNEDIYADNFASGVRGVRPATKMVAIQQFDKEDAYALWPELKENNIYGRIPGSYQRLESKEDTEKMELDILEVAWGYNRATKQYKIFAGSQCFLIDSFDDDEYPFMLHDKAYIPIFQFICMPSADGFTNYGIADMVLDLALLTRKLLNMESTHVEENTLPFTLINAPQNKVDELVEKMAMANKARAQGGKPFVAMEFDPNGGQQSVAAQALITQNLFNEWTVLWEHLTKEVSRLGINVDDIERGSGITRGQVIAEEQASNAWVLQMQEYNASSTQELIECIMDAIPQFVSAKNKTPLNLMTRITLPDGTSAKLDKQPTMGMLSKELKNGNWFVVMDSRTGAIPSDLMKMIKLEQQIAIQIPGSPMWEELNRRLAQARGIDIDLPVQAGAASPDNARPTGNEVTPIPPQPPAGTQRVLPAMTGSFETPV